MQLDKVMWAELPDVLEALEGSSVSTSSPVCVTKIALALETFVDRFCSFSLSLILLNIKADDRLEKVFDLLNKKIENYKTNGLCLNMIVK